MLNPNFYRALVYAGLLSNTLAIAACLLFSAWDHISWKSFDLALWVSVYYVHKSRGTW